jgi:hypothetical protein
MANINVKMWGVVLNPIHLCRLQFCVTSLIHIRAMRMKRILRRQLFCFIVRVSNLQMAAESYTHVTEHAET